MCMRRHCHVVSLYSRQAKFACTKQRALSSPPSPPALGTQPSDSKEIICCQQLLHLSNEPFHLHLKPENLSALRAFVSIEICCSHAMYGYLTCFRRHLLSGEVLVTCKDSAHNEGNKGISATCTARWRRIRPGVPTEDITNT